MPTKPTTYRGKQRAVGLARVGTPPRGSAHARGYGRAWQRFRLRVLADVGRSEFPRGGPMCVTCGRAAEHVDHVRPHKGCRVLLFDRLNVQSLCASCHDRKTATEDGGFGRVAKPRG